ALCPTPVENVQINQRLSQYWGRHTRWAMIRFRVLLPAVLGEPLLNPLVLVTIAALVARCSLPSLAIFGAMWLFSAAFTQAIAVIARGHGFKLWHLLLVPLRDWLFFAA